MGPENILALREAGHVKRGHNLRFTGYYDVAQHSWQATMLLYCLHPDPSPNLIKAVMFHDVGERYVGDLPAPAKWASEALAEIHGELELRAMKSLGVEIELTDEEAHWAKAVDLLELYLWSQDQMAFGNQHITQCFDKLRKWFAINMDKLPRQVAAFLDTHIWMRTNEQLPI